ncbi:MULTISPECIES: 50S ribosomal protein L30 [unclassified Candidatus Tisiphia]|uniref:50S ribosomal protein L30 n=1 Tax=unclassified Candidatus Tisiphia TaxID=2996318 RepID=UPI00312C9DC2
MSSDQEKVNEAKVKVTQIGSSIGRKYDQEKTLVGLGLNKMHKSVILKDTNSVRGMIKKVQHLLKVENIN